MLQTFHSRIPKHSQDLDLPPSVGWIDGLEKRAIAAESAFVPNKNNENNGPDCSRQQPQVCKNHLLLKSDPNKALQFDWFPFCRKIQFTLNLWLQKVLAVL